MGFKGFFRDLRIRNKLLLAYSTIFILSISISSFTIYALVRRSIETSIESELKNTTATLLNMVRTSAAISIQNHLRAVAERNREIAAHFYGQVQEGRLAPEEAKARAREVLLSQTIGKTGYIYCLNSSGVIDTHPKKELLGVDLSPYAFIQEQKLRKEGYLEYDWKNPGEATSRPKALYMTYFAPWDWIISVSSYRSEFNELIKVDDFRKSIASMKFGDTGYSYVLDSNGNLIVHPMLEGRNYYDARDASGKFFIQEIIARKSGKIAYFWKNPGEAAAREKLVIFNYIPEYDWIVASSSYLQEFYAPLRTIRKIVLAAVLVSLLVVLPITMRISASITNPLIALMSRFAKGAEGDISVRMDPRSGDELGQLARYFNTFMARLEAFSKDLQSEIVDRKKAEAAIRESEAKYRELVQSANSIILRMDTEGRITFFNEFAQRFFGYSEAEIIGCNAVGTIVPPVDSEGRDRMANIGEFAKDPERFRHHEGENVKRSGERVWISWTNRAIRDGGGRIIENLCIGNDVTESRRAQQEMTRMRLYLQNIIDSMPSILVGTDPQGRITLWNREAEKSVGVSQEAARGRHLGALFPVLASRMDMVSRAIAERQARKAEKVPHLTAGGTRYFDIVVYPLVAVAIEGAVIRMDDVTARVRMEDMMVQTEKMMSVGGLAAGMAHEINNPLGGILQSVQNIQRRLSPELAENQRIAVTCGTDLTAVQAYLNERRISSFLEGIRDSGARAARIVDNMLNFSRRSESKKIPICLTDLLEKTVELAAHDYDLKKNYDFRRIEIIRDFEENLPLVPCTPNEIEQVILNLLRNAAQASSDAPRITLRLGKIGNSARIEVADNGVGMDAETRKRVFEPFFTTKDVGIGTGLGLSVSYFIVTNNHGGSMGVESTPGEGSRFTVTLPLGDDIGPDRSAVN
ncbi:MAG: cache domain-containing protein [Pseudomonadota bacterium]